MQKKIGGILILSFILLLVFTLQGFSYDKAGSTPEMRKQEVVKEIPTTGSTARPPAGSYVKYYVPTDPNSIPSASPGTSVGTTFYDFQANYRMNKQVWVDRFGNTSMDWMKSFDVGVNNSDNPRTVYFNWRDGSTGAFLDPLGVQVTINEFKRGGYCSMAGLSGGRSVVVMHEVVRGTPPESIGTFIGIDSDVGFGSFATGGKFRNPPDSLFVDTTTAPDDTTFMCSAGIWPAGAVDLLDRIHVISNEGNEACSNNRLVYTRSLDSTGMSWTPPQLIDSVLGIPALVLVSFDPDTFKYDDTGYVALVWVSHEDWTGCTYEQEIYYRKSTNGGKTFGPKTQLTNHDGLPYRPYSDLSGIIDNSGTIHVVYQALVTDMVNCIQDDEESYIIHVAESGVQTIIQDGIWGNTKPGLSASNVYKPSIGMAHSYTNPGATDEKGVIEGRLYCTWVQFNPGDRALKGMSNGEIYGAYSKSNGASWGASINLTNSPTPGCVEVPKVPSSENTGTCDSDNWQTLADLVLNDTLAILYINDKVAGRFDEGLETSNLVKLLRIYANTVEVDAAKISSIPNKFLKSSPISGSNFTDSVTINNTGTGTLTGTVTKTQSWLSLSTGAVSIPELGAALKVTVTFMPGALAEGVYTDTITIATNAANNPTVKIPVDMVVSNNYFSKDKNYLNTPRIAVSNTSNLADQEDTSGFWSATDWPDTLGFLFDGSMLLAFKSNAGDTILARHLFNTFELQPIDSLRGPKDTSFTRSGITYDIEAVSSKVVPFTPEIGPRWPGYFYGLQIDWEMQRVIKGGDTTFWVAKTVLKTGATKPSWWPAGNVNNITIGVSNPVVIGWGLDWDIPDSDTYANSNDTNVAVPYDSALNLCAATRISPEHVAGVAFWDPIDTGRTEFTTFNVRENQIYIYPSSGYEPVQIYKIMVNDSTKLITTPKPDSLDINMVVGKKYTSSGDRTLYWIFGVENPGINTLKDDIRAARHYLEGGFVTPLCVEVEVGDLALPLNNLRTPADVVTLINTVFKSKPLPVGVNPCAADVNKSGGPPSPADVVTLINNVFKSKPLPSGTKCGC